MLDAGATPVESLVGSSAPLESPKRVRRAQSVGTLELKLHKKKKPKPEVRKRDLTSELLRATLVSAHHVFKPIIDFVDVVNDPDVGFNELAAIFRFMHNAWPEVAPVNFNSPLLASVAAFSVVAQTEKLRSNLTISFTERELPDVYREWDLDVKRLMTEHEEVVKNLFNRVKDQVPCKDFIEQLPAAPCDTCHPVLKLYCSRRAN
jgi:hypothetical protein